MKKRSGILIVCLLVALALLSGCLPSAGAAPEEAADGSGEAPAETGEKPAIPEKLSLRNGVPQLTVYDAGRQSYASMDMEEYVAGVLAGEMRNDWPMEALKAQAILARTFVLKFVEEKESRYQGADISTDIREAQAYDPDKVNERIKRAVEETRGLVMSAGGELPYAWFHAHAGGMTELAKAGLEYEKDEPPYTRSVQSEDSDRAPTAVKNWTAAFGAEEVGKACQKAGVKTGTVKSIEIGEKSAAGRAITLNVNGKSVSAPKLRLALDSTKLKSTLLDSVKLENGKVVFAGRGYGHGVGMSQWGAYGMAESGKSAEQIVQHYFKNLSVVRLWE